VGTGKGKKKRNFPAKVNKKEVSTVRICLSTGRVSKKKGEVQYNG